MRKESRENERAEGVHVSGKGGVRLVLMAGGGCSVVRMSAGPRDNRSEGHQRLAPTLSGLIGSQPVWVLSSLTPPPHAGGTHAPVLSSLPNMVSAPEKDSPLTAASR